MEALIEKFAGKIIHVIIHTTRRVDLHSRKGDYSYRGTETSHFNPLERTQNLSPRYPSSLSPTVAVMLLSNPFLKLPKKKASKCKLPLSMSRVNAILGTCKGGHYH